MRRTEIKAILSQEEIGAEVVVKGWVRNYRGNNFVMFVALNDGSSLQNLQIVIDNEKFDAQLLKKITVGSSLSITGIIAKSEGKGQSIEILASLVEVLGTANADEYPLQPKKHSLEFLREIGHLRFRSNTFGAITRIRHQMIYAIHTFFNERGFYNIHTPIITGSDCEGAGEMFQVTTLDLKKPPLTKEGHIDFSEDFFGKQTNLTVSGQLEVEMACMAMSKVYTFGPTFRAENSNTSRHLAEFWMIEPEVAFADIYDDMDLAEEFLKYLISYALKHCREDLEFLQDRLLQEEKSKPEQDRSMPLIEKLEFVLANDFQRLTYTEAIEILKESKPNKKGQFKYDVKGFGTDLQSEHERYLVEKHFKKPVILTGYPKEIKAFYMKQNPDGKTVAAMDVLFPQIGEIIGGSEREADYDKLYNRMIEMNIPTEDLHWYLDSRKYGAVPHAGFGLGFERLMLFVTGMGNIRDVIPFPRYPKSAEF
ncbi:MAG TPA: asparagine--tRNA ligase [Bacteroidales bacterium]|nr:MAG: Asparagine--tRNA ligase [Bacteroidetes bacterium ADurb.Bin217]HPM12933.1 asparagine--tRNA ligase [Bacteroidales bacterium]